MSTLLAGLFPRKRPLFLKELSIPAAARITVLAPHPDDFDVAGVTLRFLRDQGNRIDLAVLTSGASGVEDDFSASPDTAVKAALREAEQCASCRFFGLPESRLVFLRLQEDESGHPLESAENIQRVREVLIANRPDIVFLPHWNDSNPGHQRAYAIFRQIVLAENLSPIAFLNQDPKTANMRHDLYSPFGEDEAQWKGKLLRFHQSQQQRNLRARGIGFDERILRANRQSALVLDGQAAYTEVFELEFFNASPSSA